MVLTPVTFDNDTEFTIEKIKLEGQDHIVSLIEKNSSGKRLTGSVFVLPLRVRIALSAICNRNGTDCLGEDKRI